jgi:hypothetical protein
MPDAQGEREAPVPQDATRPVIGEILQVVVANSAQKTIARADALTSRADRASAVGAAPSSGRRQTDEAAPISESG